MRGGKGEKGEEGDEMGVLADAGKGREGTGRAGGRWRHRLVG